MTFTKSTALKYVAFFLGVFVWGGGLGQILYFLGWFNTTNNRALIGSMAMTLFFSSILGRGLCRFSKKEHTPFYFFFIPLGGVSVLASSAESVG